MRNILEQEIDLNRLIENKIILNHFPLHTYEREHILEAWKRSNLQLTFGFMTQSFVQHMQPLNIMKDYYGLQVAFDFAWRIHYTGWLIVLSIFSCIYIAIAMIY